MKSCLLVKLFNYFFVASAFRSKRNEETQQKKKAKSRFLIVSKVIKTVKSIELYGN